MTGVHHCLRRMVGGSAGAVLVLLTAMGSVHADPSSDALASIKELSRQALQTREAVTAAQLDLDARLAAQKSADDRHSADVAALELANAQLEPHQAAVDRVAAMTYMNGSASQLSAVLTATSPHQLINGLALQRTIAAVSADQLRAFTASRARAAAAAEASAASAAEARTAAEKSAAVRADLQATWKELQRQIAAAEAQYAALTPQQQAVVDNALPPGPPPTEPAPQDPAIVALPAPPEPPIAPEPGPPGDPAAALMAARVGISDALPVGVASEAGLRPNTVLAARAVSAQFPQIREIGGVRPDSKPWHPSGRAIDIMVPNPSSPEGIALGDAILNFVLSNAGPLGLQDAIWRGTYYTPGGPAGSGYGHYDHVHVTTR